MTPFLTIAERLGELLAGAKLTATPLPLTPEIRLYLIREDFPRQTLSPDDMRRLMDEPFFWPFCWPSGQVLARRLRDERDSIRGKKILDFGAGSGVVAIAAALYGAGEVVALDSDPLSCTAIQANAELNDVSLEISDNLASLNDDFDLVLVADVLYDRNNFPLLDKFAKLGKRVLIADSRVKELPSPYTKIGQLPAVTLPDLGDPAEYRTVALFAFPS